VSRAAEEAQFPQNTFDQLDREGGKGSHHLLYSPDSSEGMGAEGWLIRDRMG
jgi:hypothetical protein